jgi:hypothetical protein
MRSLVIRVVRLPVGVPFDGEPSLLLALQGKKANLEGKPEGDDWICSVDVALGADGAPRGEWVHKYGDKRPFIYLTWYGSSGRIVRRIKLYCDLIPAEATEVRVAGTDRHGHPACSTAVVLTD